MSGIVGIVNFDAAPVDPNLLWTMTDYMSYRGPDRQQIWSDSNVGFGHTLLRSGSQTETADQPLTLDDDNVWLIADARIDGREELLDKLGISPLDNITDPELILRAYEVWGSNCVEHLIGDFAFAVWDKRSQTLFCARDHFGVKPFFYFLTPNSFAFSNTLNALRLHPSISDTLNEIAVGDYLLFGLNQDLSTTIFNDIRRLPAGNTLTIRNASISRRHYWTPEVKEIRFRDSQSYVQRFTELFTRAIQDRLPSGRVALSMSGGLDSSSIGVIARDLLDGDSLLQAFTVVYDTLIPDQERYYSTIAAEHIGIPITHINADRYDLFDEQVPGDMDQPEPFLLSPFAGQFSDLLRLCSSFGRVALTGYDGDAVMTERPSPFFASCAKQLRLGELVAGLASYIFTQKSVPPIGFRTNLKRFLRSSDDYFYPSWIDESFEKRTNLRERWLQSISIKTREALNGGSRPATLQALNSNVWAPLFEGYDPGATKLLLEVRHPLIDRRLIEFLLGIPAVPWCVNKHILRMAMNRRLPETVVTRRKTPLAGDPALQLIRGRSVGWFDDFPIHSQLKNYIDLDSRLPLADEQTSDAVWASLRVFALNFWLTNSHAMARQRIERCVSMGRSN